MSSYRGTMQPELDAVSWDSTAVSPAVHSLLIDASLPAQPGELTGLVAALNAYAYESRSAGPRSSVLARLLAAKLLIATLAAGSLGGVALAASAGDLPAPLQDVAHAAVPAAPASHGKGAEHDKAQHSADQDSPAAPSGTTTLTPSLAPSPSLVGLCHAYAAGVKDSSGKALDNPAFTVLVTTAGSKDAVTGYCKTLLAGTHPRPSARPTLPSHPTTKPTHPGHPTGKPATHPTGKPTHPAHAPGKPAAHPPGKPAAHPTGKPAAEAQPTAEQTEAPEPAGHPTPKPSKH